MKLERLLSITMLLLGRDSVTAGELAERFEVSRRTIYRDIEALALAGLPVVTAQGAGGGISLMPSYCIERSLFSEQERAALLLSLQSLGATPGLGVELALEKLRALFKGATPEDWIRVEFAPWGSGRGEGEKLDTVRSALLQHQVVQFDYLGADGTLSHRIVEPMTILYRGTAWYLWGYCRLRAGFRTFRLSRIQELRVDAERFSRRPVRLGQSPAPEAEWPPAVALLLRFVPSAAQRVYDEYDPQQIRVRPDGSFLVSVTYPAGEWVYGHLLSHGPLVEVLSPPEVREALLERAEAIAKLYSSSKLDRLMSTSVCDNEAK